MKRFFPVPYWNEECKRHWKERERLYSRYRRTGIIADKIAWKKQRAITKKTINTAKQTEFRDYLSSMKNDTPMSQIYEKLRKIRGYPPRKITFLHYENRKITSTKDIANVLAETLAETSSYRNSSPTFKQIQFTQETDLIFPEDNSIPYNFPFTKIELQSALSSAKNSSPGPDQVHYLMLKNLPEPFLNHLLKIYNKLWSTHFYPPQWREAIIIPIPKPGKDHSNPTNYRPIALAASANFSKK